MRILGNRQGPSSFATQERPVASGVTLTDGDFVNLASGAVSNAGISTKKLYGIMQGSDSSNLFSQTFRNTAVGNVAQTVTALCVLVDGLRLELPVNGSLASDASGKYYNLIDTSSALLTSDATAPSNNDTVTIGGQVYTFKTTLTGAAFEVLIGASAAAALDNLKEAVNDVGTEGTNYGTGTTANTSVTATTNTNTTQLFVAIDTAALIAVSEASTHLSFDTTTLTGGTGRQSVDNLSKSATVGQLFCESRIATNAAGTEFKKGIFVVTVPQDVTTLS